MKPYHLLSLAFVLFHGFWPGIAQTVVDLRTQSKNVDFTNASSTKPFRSGTTLPASCSANESFLKTNATPGQNLYVCTTPGDPGAWTVQGGSGTSAPNYYQGFTNQNSVTLSHNLNSTAIVVVCYDSAASPNSIEFNSLHIVDGNTAAVTFGAPQSGTCVVNSSGGGGGGGDGSSPGGTFGQIQFNNNGTLAGGNLSGDAITSDSLVTTLASSGVTAGTYGNAAHVPQIQVDAKGRVTVANNVPISGGGGAGAISQLTDFALSATPSTATVACASAACQARIGEKVFTFAAAAATASSLTGTGALSTVYFFIDANGVLSFGHDGSAVNDATVSGFTKVTGVTNFPPNTLPIGRCAVNGNQFGACTDDRALLERMVIDQGAGISVTQNPVTGHTAIAANPTTVGFLGAANTWSNINDFSTGTILYNVVTKTSDYTVAATDYTVLCGTGGGPVTVTLPASPVQGQMLIVKNIGSNPCTVGSNGKNIDGSPIQSVNSQNAVLRMQFDGFTWRLL